MFNLHWVDIGTTYAEWETASTWSVSYAVSDEEVIKAVVGHEEGQIPSLSVMVANPQIGLLNATRKKWAWFSCLINGVNYPLFFGRLVGIPTDLLGEAVTLEFTARSKYFSMNKQIAAESLKVFPYYDPVFIDVSRRDDADAILEGYSALWHIDRVSLDITPSDVLVGEDGTAVFLESEVPYDSVGVTLNQSPLIAVAVQAQVSWNQAFTGYLDGGSGKVETYSGDGMIADWPRPGSQLSSGWTVMSSFMKDKNRIQYVQNISYSKSWQNRESRHNNGDTMSYSMSKSYPNLGANTDIIRREITRSATVGVNDPSTVDLNGNPSPTNIPASLSYTATIVPKWDMRYNIGLRYDAARARTERIEFILAADAQPILVDAQLSQDTDIITLTGADVSMPVIDFKAWSSVAGKYVGIGQFIFPDDPLVPGQTSIQVSVVAGIAGTVIPTFSNAAGTTTTDGTVVWSSLGSAMGISNITTDWQKFQTVPLGNIILPRVPFSILYKDLVSPGRAQTPSVGTSISIYQIVEVPNQGFFQCTLSGITANKNPNWKTNGAITKDGTVEWTFIGTALPSGVDYYIVTHAGTTGEYLPRFGDGTSQVTDGTVVWTRLPAVEVPIGGAPGMIPRNDYFPTDRGLKSLEYLMCLARARLRMRARAVEISFNCAFEKAMALSCRMNATLYDRRLPGGAASGKVISYTLTADGNAKKIIGSVKIGCSVGNADDIILSSGDPTYVSEGYVSPGYQSYSDSVIGVVDDLGYTPPASNVTDKFTFPLTQDQVFLNGGFVTRGSLSAQKKAIGNALQAAWIAANLSPKNIDSVQDSINAEILANRAAWNSVGVKLQENPIWLELELLPVSGLQYENFYSIATTSLKLPKTIDLSASSTVTPPATSGSIIQAGAAFRGVANGDTVGAVPFTFVTQNMGGAGSMQVVAQQLFNVSLRMSGKGAFNNSITLQFASADLYGDGYFDNIQAYTTADMAAQYWRIQINATDVGLGTDAFVAKIEFYETLWGPNVAYGGTPIDSAHNTDYGPENAFSEDTRVEAFEINTYWDSGSTFDTSYIGYDFGVPRNITNFLIHGMDNFLNRQIAFYDLQYSYDGTTWVSSWGNNSYDYPVRAAYELTYYENPALTGPEFFGSPWGAHRYWRIAINKSHWAGDLVMAGIEMRARPGGPNIATGGTATASTEEGGYVASNAFDGNNASEWRATLGIDWGWIYYDFGTAVEVSEIALTASADTDLCNAMPCWFSLQFSDDPIGESWTTTFKILDEPNFDVSEQRVFTDSFFSLALNGAGNGKMVTKASVLQSGNLSASGELSAEATTRSNGSARLSGSGYMGAADRIYGDIGAIGESIMSADATLEMLASASLTGAGSMTSEWSGIVFVGSASVQSAANAPDRVMTLNALVGGQRPTVAEGDIVIAVYQASVNSDLTLVIEDPSATPYTLIGSEMYVNSTNDTNLRVAYKIMDSTPDSTVTFKGIGGSSNNGLIYTVYVFSGVDTTTPLDVTPTSSSATNSVIVNPAAITPVTVGATVVVVGAGAHTRGGVLYTSSDLRRFESDVYNTLSDITSGIGYIPDWASGAVDPAAWTFGSTDLNQYTYACITFALRPA